jgi:hypothetical protein
MRISNCGVLFVTQTVVCVRGNNSRCIGHVKKITQSSLTRCDSAWLFDPGIERPAKIQPSLGDEAANVL